MRWRHWDDEETIKRETVKQLKSLTPDDIQEYFEQWKRMWDKYISTNGELKKIIYIYWTDFV